MNIFRVRRNYSNGNSKNILVYFGIVITFLLCMLGLTFGLQSQSSVSNQMPSTVLTVHAYHVLFHPSVEFDNSSNVQQVKKHISKDAPSMSQNEHAAGIGGKNNGVIKSILHGPKGFKLGWNNMRDSTKEINAVKRADAKYGKHSKQAKAAVAKAEGKSKARSRSIKNKASKDDGSTGVPFYDAANDVAQKSSDIDSSAKSKGNTYGLSGSADIGRQWSRLAGSKNGLWSKLVENTYSFNVGSYINPLAMKGASTTKMAANGENTRNEGYAAEFQIALTQMGLDHSKSAAYGKDMIARMGRYIGGAALLALYVANYAAYVMLEYFGKFLNIINPEFYMYHLSLNSPMGGVAQVMHQWMYYLSNLGLIWAFLIWLVTLGLGYLGFKGLHYRGGSKAGGMLKATGVYFLRCICIIALPVAVLSLSTFLFSFLKGPLSSNTDNIAEQTVESGLVDDRGWYENSRLGIPSSLKIPISKTNFSSYPAASPKDILAINGDGAGISGAKQFENESSPQVALKNDVENTSQKQQSFKTVFEQPNNMDSIGMLKDWMEGTTYTSADWASYAKSRMPGVDSASSSDVENALTSKTGSPGSSSKKKNANASNVNGKASQQYPYINNGSLHDAGGYFSTNGVDSSSSADHDETQEGGLSALGMYNYMSTVPNGTGSVKWTGSAKLQNMFTMPMHMDIGLAGTGVTAMGNYARIFGILFALSYIGINGAKFAYELLIKFTLMQISNAIRTSLGSLQAAGRLIGLIIALVAQLIGLVLVLEIARAMIVGIVTYIDNDLENAGGSAMSLMNWFGLPHQVIAAAGGTNATAYGAAELIEGVVLVFGSFKISHYMQPVLGSLASGLKAGTSKLFSSASNSGVGHGVSAGAAAAMGGGALLAGKGLGKAGKAAGRGLGHGAGAAGHIAGRAGAGLISHIMGGSPHGGKNSNSSHGNSKNGFHPGQALKHVFHNPHKSNHHNNHPVGGPKTSNNKDDHGKPGSGDKNSKGNSSNNKNYSPDNMSGRDAGKMADAVDNGDFDNPPSPKDGHDATGPNDSQNGNDGQDNDANQDNEDQNGNQDGENQNGDQNDEDQNGDNSENNPNNNSSNGDSRNANNKSQYGGRHNATNNYNGQHRNNPSSSRHGVNNVHHNGRHSGNNASNRVHGGNSSRGGIRNGSPSSSRNNRSYGNSSNNEDSNNHSSNSTYGSNHSRLTGSPKGTPAGGPNNGGKVPMVGNHVRGQTSTPKEISAARNGVRAANNNVHSAKRAIAARAARPPKMSPAEKKALGGRLHQAQGQLNSAMKYSAAVNNDAAINPNNPHVSKGGVTIGHARRALKSVGSAQVQMTQASNSKQFAAASNNLKNAKQNALSTGIAPTSIGNIKETSHALNSINDSLQQAMTSGDWSTKGIG